MRVHVGGDHAAFDLKLVIIAYLRSHGHEVVDHGAHVDDPQDDYPAFCLRTGEAVVNDPGSLGIVLGGSGNGEQIAANKVKGVRAALAWNLDTARLAREHNNANVVGIGARQHEESEAVQIVDAFVSEPFSEGDRHKRRIAMISQYEADGTLPPLPGGD
jgi:ribose 5-phosphate isomerase B